MLIILKEWRILSIGGTQARRRQRGQSSFIVDA